MREVRGQCHDCFAHVSDKFTNLPSRKTLPSRATYPKLFRSRADKVSATSHLGDTPMSSTCQTAQEQRPANLAANLTALHQTLKEMAARTKSSIPTTKERSVVLQGPVIVIKGK